MNNILKVTAYSIGAAALSYAGWYFISSKANSACNYYNPRIDWVKNSLSKLEAKIKILDQKGFANCYSTNRVAYHFGVTHKHPIIKEEEVNEYEIFDSLLNELILNKNKFKQESQKLFELSESFNSKFMAYECFRLDRDVLRSEREVKTLMFEFDEMMFYNYPKLCESSIYKRWEIQSVPIDFDSAL